MLISEENLSWVNKMHLKKSGKKMSFSIKVNTVRILKIGLSSILLVYQEAFITRFIQFKDFFFNLLYQKRNTVWFLI